LSFREVAVKLRWHSDTGNRKIGIDMKRIVATFGTLGVATALGIV